MRICFLEDSLVNDNLKKIIKSIDAKAAKQSDDAVERIVYFRMYLLEGGLLIILIASFCINLI